MTNGNNAWKVSFAQISWLQEKLKGHPNIGSVARCKDILFSVARSRQGDQLQVLCCDEYVMGISAVHRALAEFEKLDIIYIGGGWNKYTKQAKDFCLSARIGLYNTNEMTGALWKDEFWAYHKTSDKGDPTYFFGTE